MGLYEPQLEIDWWEIYREIRFYKCHDFILKIYRSIMCTRKLKVIPVNKLGTPYISKVKK